MMLAALALLGLGIFGPGIATGLVSGAPQLGAGAAAGTLSRCRRDWWLREARRRSGAARLATGTAGTSVRAATSMVKGARTAYTESAAPRARLGAGAMGAGFAGVGRAGAESAGQAVKNWARRAAGGAGARTDDKRRDARDGHSGCKDVNTSSVASRRRRKPCDPVNTVDRAQSVTTRRGVRDDIQTSQCAVLDDAGAPTPYQAAQQLLG